MYQDSSSFQPDLIGHTPSVDNRNDNINTCLEAVKKRDATINVAFWAGLIISPTECVYSGVRRVRRVRYVINADEWVNLNLVEDRSKTDSKIGTRRAFDRRGICIVCE